MAFDDMVLAGTESKIVEIMVRDSTTGAGKTGLVYGDVTYCYVREGDATNRVYGTCIAMAGGALDAWASAGFKEIDATNAPGLYQFGVPNACLAAGKNAVNILLKGSGFITDMTKILIMGSDLRAAALAANATQWLGQTIHAATVNGVPVVQMHDSAGAGGINAPANFEDLSVADTTGLVAVPTTQKVDVETIKTRAITCSAGVTVLASVGTAATDTAQTGDAYGVVNHADHGNAKLVRSTTPGNTLSVDANHLVAVPDTQEVVLADSAAHGGSSAVITLATPIVANATQIEGTDATTQLEAAVDAALENVMPGTPTAGSANAGLKKVDGMIEAY